MENILNGDILKNLKESLSEANAMLGNTAAGFRELAGILSSVSAGITAASAIGNNIEGISGLKSARLNKLPLNNGTEKQNRENNNIFSEPDYAGLTGKMLDNFNGMLESTRSMLKNTGLIETGFESILNSLIRFSDTIQSGIGLFESVSGLLGSVIGFIGGGPAGAAIGGSLAGGLLSGGLLPAGLHPGILPGSDTGSSALINNRAYNLQAAEPVQNVTIIMKNPVSFQKAFEIETRNSKVRTQILEG